MLKCNHAPLVVARSVLLAKAIGQQDFSTDDLEAKAPSLACQELHEAVQTLGVSSGVTVSEVIEDSMAIRNLRTSYRQ